VTRIPGIIVEIIWKRRDLLEDAVLILSLKISTLVYII